MNLAQWLHFHCHGGPMLKCGNQQWMLMGGGMESRWLISMGTWPYDCNSFHPGSWLSDPLWGYIEI